MFLGWAVTSVLGTPFCALIRGLAGWRTAIALVGLLSLASAVWVLRVMPNDVKPPTLSASSWRQTIQSLPLVLCIVATVLYSAGQFVLFSCLALYFKSRLRVTPIELSLFFAWLGVFGFTGNLLVSRHIDHLGASRAGASASPAWHGSWRCGHSEPS